MKVTYLLINPYRMSQLYDLIWSALALFVFWVSGAAIFQAIEGWSYGNATYAVVILTTTIGQSVLFPIVRAALRFLSEALWADMRGGRFRRLCTHRATRENCVDPLHAYGCANHYILCRANYCGCRERLS
jgi:hypothetical protein